MLAILTVPTCPDRNRQLSRLRNSETLAMVMTERPARVRLMATSQMVPLNSAAFIAVIGNGLSVSEDLARRFLGVDLDAQCEDPEARQFPAGFLESIFGRRSDLLAGALTIWRWGRQKAARAMVIRSTWHTPPRRGWTS